jgi:hypothetical protein
MITIATLLWDANKNSHSFSAHYTELDVEKLYRGFARNLSLPFEFVVFTDRKRDFAEPVGQQRIKAEVPDYSSCIDPFILGEPMILVGLDTVVTGNIDHLAKHCLDGKGYALPRDPYKPHIACNGVALVPAGMERVALEHDGQNDMDHCRSYPHQFIDDLYPGHVVSYKGHVKKHGLGDARIVYFHGQEKPHQLNEPWLKEAWV